MMRHLSYLIAAVALVACTQSMRAQADSVAPAPATIEITDAKLGTGVENRMVTGEATSFPKDSKVFLWLKVTGAGGASLNVTWKAGDASHSTTLTVGGSPWRTWASKTVGKAGEWKVTVTDEAGSVLKELSFTVE